MKLLIIDNEIRVYLVKLDTLSFVLVFLFAERLKFVLTGFQVGRQFRFFGLKN